MVDVGRSQFKIGSKERGRRCQTGDGKLSERELPRRCIATGYEQAEYADMSRAGDHHLGLGQARSLSKTLPFIRRKARSLNVVGRNEI